jgi:hypothetical protein
VTIVIVEMNFRRSSIKYILEEFLRGKNKGLTFLERPKGIIVVWRRIGYLS